MFSSLKGLLGGFSGVLPLARDILLLRLTADILFSAELDLENLGDFDVIYSYADSASS